MIALPLLSSMNYLEITIAKFSIFRSIFNYPWITAVMLCRGVKNFWNTPFFAPVKLNFGPRIIFSTGINIPFPRPPPSSTPSHPLLNTLSTRELLRFFILILTPMKINYHGKSTSVSMLHRSLPMISPLKIYRHRYPPSNLNPPSFSTDLHYTTIQTCTVNHPYPSTALALNPSKIAINPTIHTNTPITIDSSRIRHPLCYLT